jgi:hypothetical protein
MIETQALTALMMKREGGRIKNKFYSFKMSIQRITTGVENS